jgi:IS5 family transposase
MVFTIESGLADELKKPADDFRVKDLFDARAFNTTRIEVTRQGQTLAFEKDKDAWKQVTPAAKAADAAKVEALLTALTNTRATGFEPKIAVTGLDAPELTVTVKFEDGKKEEKVAFAKKGTDAFARRENDATAAKIDQATLESIIKAFDALK